MFRGSLVSADLPMLHVVFDRFLWNSVRTSCRWIPTYSGAF